MLPSSEHSPLMTHTHLRCYVGVLLAVTIHVVSVDVVTAGESVDGLHDDAGVVVGDDVGIAIFYLVDLHVGVVPGELLAGLNRLILL